MNNIIILVSQAKDNLAFDSLYVDLSISCVTFFFEEILYWNNRFIICTYNLCSLLHLLMYVYFFYVE